MAEIVGRIIKLVLLLGVIVLGIVFMPDDFLARLQSGAASAREFVQGEVSNRIPAIGRELDTKFAATREEVISFYVSTKEKFSATVGKWVWEQINGRFSGQ
jgi:hypothetical protein